VSSTPQPIFSLTEGRARAADVGGKAAALAELSLAGLPVPPGFVLGAEALSACVRSAELVPLCEKAARAEAAGDSEQAQQLGARAAAALREISIPAWLMDELARAHRELLATPLLPGTPSRPPALLVVRSSALGEDGELRSHAGQYESVLNLRGLEGLVEGVRAVWASWYSDRAIDYRLRQRGASSPTDRADLVGEPTIPPMAVLVQRLVPARASGMLFTANPATGALDEMTCEAGPLLGEPLAQGRVHPDFFSVRRLRGGRLKTRHRVIGTKALQSLPRPAGSGSLDLCEVPEKQRRKACISRRELKRICRLGLEVEARMGGPSDIEWCIDGRGRIFLLQARPITALRPRRRSLSRPLRERPVLWTQRFAGERWTQQATPLGWSVIQPVLHHFIEWKGVSEGWLEGSAPTRLYRGRPYLNVSIFRHLAFRLPGMSPPQFLLEMFPADEQDELLYDAPYLPNPTVVSSILWELLRERRWRRYHWGVFSNHSEWESFQPVFERSIAALPLDFPDAAAGLAHIETARGLMRDYMGIHLLSLLFAHLGYELLDKALRGWSGVEGQAIRSALVAEPGQNETLRANAAVWHLAELVRGKTELLGALSGAEPGVGETLESPLAAEVPEVLPVEALLCGTLDDVTGGRALRLALAAFLEEFGHRSSASYEIFATRWSDSPELVLQMLLNCLRAPPEQHPSRRAARRERDRSRAESLVARRMSRGWIRHLLPWRRSLFGELLELTRSYMALRENQRFSFDRLLLRTKRIFERIGAQLEQQALLERGEDLVFLKIAEVADLVSGGLSADLAAERIAGRKREFDANASALHPDFLEGEEQLEAAQPEAPGEYLQGLGISPGRARGTVRVLRSLAEVDKLRSGDILVARGVDPGWTPLFLTLGGLVLELGSMLSHAAVVAREYGLPAVVNIEGATHILEDGMEITVDGDRGRVLLHRAAKDPKPKERNVLDRKFDA
jgi:pyruvate,water dikinase